MSISPKEEEETTGQIRVTHNKQVHKDTRKNVQTIRLDTRERHDKQTRGVMEFTFNAGSPRVRARLHGSWF